MSVAVNTPTPFLPITSLQLQHLQVVTRSFAQRRPTISSVFNNFRTLSVATGWHPLLLGFSWASELRAFALLCFHAVANWSSFRNHPQCPACRVPSRFRSMRTNERLPRRFSGGKKPMQNPCMAQSPFNAVYRHSMHGNTIRRKVWSHTANSGRLDAETFGGSAQFPLLATPAARGAAQSHEQ